MMIHINDFLLTESIQINNDLQPVLNGLINDFKIFLDQAVTVKTMLTNTAKGLQDTLLCNFTPKGSIINIPRPIDTGFNSNWLNTMINKKGDLSTINDYLGDPASSRKPLMSKTHYCSSVISDSLHKAGLECSEFCSNAKNFALDYIDSIVQDSTITVLPVRDTGTNFPIVHIDFNWYLGCPSIHFDFPQVNTGRHAYWLANIGEIINDCSLVFLSITIEGSVYGVGRGIWINDLDTLRVEVERAQGNFYKSGLTTYRGRLTRARARQTGDELDDTLETLDEQLQAREQIKNVFESILAYHDPNYNIGEALINLSEERLEMGGSIPAMLPPGNIVRHFDFSALDNPEFFETEDQIDLPEAQNQDGPSEAGPSNYRRNENQDGPSEAGPSNYRRNE